MGVSPLVLLLCVASCVGVIKAEAPSLLFFSPSDALFRPDSVDMPSQTMSPRAAAAASAALLGLPSPSTTDATTAQQVDSLLPPTPFSRASWMLFLTLSSSSSSSSGDAQALRSAAFGECASPSSPSSCMLLRQHRALPAPASHAVAGNEAGAGLGGEMRSMLAQLGGSVALHSAQGAAAEGAAGEWDKMAALWDSAVLNASPLGALPAYAFAALFSCLSPSAKAVLLRELSGIERVIEESWRTASPPVLASAVLSLKGLGECRPEADSGADESREQRALKGALAFIARLIQASQPANSQVAVVVMVDETEEGAQGVASQLEWSVAEQQRGRALVEEGEGEMESKDEPHTPQQVALDSVYFVTLLLLFTALILATLMLFNMPVTRDTLLYSGAKLD